MAHLFSFGNGIIELKIMAHRVVVVITPLALPPVQLLFAVASVPFPQDKCRRGHQDQTTTSGTHILLLHDHIIRGGWIVIVILVAVIVVVVIRGQCLDDRSVVPLCCLLLVHVGRQHQLLIVMVIVELNRHFLLLVPIESSSCSACSCSFTHPMTIHPEIIILITLPLLLL